MSDQEHGTPEPLKIPAGVQQQTEEMVREAFSSLGEHLQRMRHDVDEFNRKRQETREKIGSGARRTNGRLV